MAKVLPSEEEATRTARDRVAFSNSSMYEIWWHNNCRLCVHEEDCPLLLVALLGQTPAAWRDQGLQNYVCYFKEQA